LPGHKKSPFGRIGILGKVYHGRGECTIYAGRAFFEKAALFALSKKTLLGEDRGYDPLISAYDSPGKSDIKDMPPKDQGDRIALVASARREPSFVSKII
jgi:hypothetical protein